MTSTVNATLSGTATPAQKTARTSAKVMVTGDGIFTTVGDILLFALVSECYSANDATASTLQYNCTNNGTGVSQTLSGVSASLANAPKGAAAVAQLGALTNAPVVSNAAGVGVFPWGAVRIPGGSTIKTTIGVGSTVGTWAHYIKYEPLEDGAYVTSNF